MIEEFINQFVEMLPMFLEIFIVIGGTAALLTVIFKILNAWMLEKPKRKEKPKRDYQHLEIIEPPEHETLDSLLQQAQEGKH